jgi:hypothetical protein
LVVLGGEDRLPYAGITPRADLKYRLADGADGKPMPPGRGDKAPPGGTPNFNNRPRFVQIAGDGSSSTRTIPTGRTGYYGLEVPRKTFRAFSPDVEIAPADP